MFQPELIGIVAIGRNEGERLITCLRSALDCCPNVVYVDSGSSDGSVAAAERLGVDIVKLDMSKPFTAARARNAGALALLQKHDLKFLQFIDGDCEFFDDWLKKAEHYLLHHPSAAIVAGKLHERHPEASIYNRMCDIEWDTPEGDTKACGGIMMMRSETFKQVQGFNESLIAGEEPEMCVRLRLSGWKIHRLADDMALHDADMHDFSQWWKRSQRAGYAYAEGASLHGAPPEQHWVKERNRAWVWAGAIPILCLIATWIHPLLGLLALGVYPLQIVRTAWHFAHLGSFKWTQASFLMLGKFAEFIGQLKYYQNKLLSKQSRLIEHKR